MPTQNPLRDPLTELWSWKYVEGVLPGILGHNGQVALIFIDIDRMKPFQDAHGFAVGDQKIRTIAREITRISGEHALVFRYGGDEFGVILYESSLENAREIAEKIRAARQPIFVMSSGKEVATLTLSLGIAHFPTHVSNAENLLVAAELALMKIKGEGSSRLSDGTPFTPRNRVMAIGDFWDDFLEQSAAFLR